MTEPVKVKFDLPETIPELQFLAVLAQVADLFSKACTDVEMERVANWFHAKYGSES